MAELDHAYHFPGVESIQVEVDMMDFAFIETCDDWKKLMKVLQVLSSGKEGHYPELMRAAEERMVSIMPMKEKRKYAALTKTTVPVEEVLNAEQDLLNWMKQTAELDSKLASKSKTDDNFNDFPHLYLLSKHQQGKIFEARNLFNWDNLSNLQKDFRSEAEKKKGNECFKAGDYDDAVKFYTNSIALNCYSSAAWCNRALAHLKKELYDLAEMDCNVAIALDPSYVKALLRRGTTRISLGKYKEAAYDLKEVIKLSPETSKDTEKLLQKALDKYREVEGKDLVFEAPNKQPVEEDEDEDDEDCIEIPIRISSNISVEMETSPAVPSVTTIPRSAARSQSESIPVTKVSALKDLLLPGVETFRVSGSKITWTAIPEEVTVGVEEEKAAESAPSEFVRVVIEDDDSDDEGDSEGEEIPINFTSNSQGNEDDGTNEEEEIEIPIKHSEEVSAADLFAEALSLLKQKNFAQANMKLTKYLDHTEQSSSVDKQQILHAHYYRAYCSVQLKDFSEVFGDMSTLLTADGNNAWAKKVQFKISFHSTSDLSELFTVENGNVTLLSSEEYKEHGSKAVEKKDYLTATEKYSLSLLVDATNIASLNNRALSYLRANDFAPAIQDASAVLQVCSSLSSTDAESIENNKQIKIKAYYRRAEARYKLAASMANAKDAEETVDRDGHLDGALRDITALVALGNNTATTNKLKADIIKLQQSIATATTPTTPSAPLPTHPPVKEQSIVTPPTPPPIPPTTAAPVTPPAPPAPPAVAVEKVVPPPVPTTTPVTVNTPAAKESKKDLPPPAPVTENDFKAVATTRKSETSSTAASTAAPTAAPTAAAAPVPVMSTPAKTTKETGKTTVTPQPTSTSKAAKTPSTGSKKSTPGKSISISTPLSCPSELPKTGFEFERQWRNLHGHNQQRLNYLEMFKSSTYKKVFKESSSSENFSSILQTLNDSALTVDTQLLVDVLEGVAQSKSLDMILMLLPEEDLAILDKLFGRLDAEVPAVNSVSLSNTVAEIRQKYNIKH